MLAADRVASPPFDLKDHVALVTGANHRIGAATASLLAGCGASVLVTWLRLRDPEDLHEPFRVNRAQGADAVIAGIRARGGSAIGQEADLRDCGEPARLVDLAEREIGSVDILINNASGWVADTFAPAGRHASGARKESVTAATHDAAFSVDARGSALTIAEFARRHVARHGSWGRIVGLTSGGPLGFPNEVSYGAAKAALENHTMSAAFELAPFGVTANIVYPPVTNTGWVTAEVRTQIERHPGLLHVVGPQEVAEVVAFLCSDQARPITANVVHLR